MYVMSTWQHTHLDIHRKQPHKRLVVNGNSYHVNTFYLKITGYERTLDVSTYVLPDRFLLTRL